MHLQFFSLYFSFCLDDDSLVRCVLCSFDVQWMSAHGFLSHVNWWIGLDWIVENERRDFFMAMIYHTCDMDKRCSGREVLDGLSDITRGGNT